jgi:hypothetical protein
MNERTSSNELVHHITLGECIIGSQLRRGGLVIDRIGWDDNGAITGKEDWRRPRTGIA